MSSGSKKIRFKKENLLLLVFITILVLFLIRLIFITKGILKKDVISKDTVEVIQRYNYKLYENNTKYYKKLFKELKNILNTENVNEEEYAKKVSQLFIADFYDLNSKTNKNDVGGVQYIYTPNRTDFIKFATDSNGIYYIVENSVDNKRKQVLPSIEKVEVISVERVNYKYEKIEDSQAYKIILDIKYNKDLGYPIKAEIVLIHVNEKLEIVEIN